MTTFLVFSALILLQLKQELPSKCSCQVLFKIWWISWAIHDWLPVKNDKCT